MRDGSEPRTAPLLDFRRHRLRALRRRVLQRVPARAALLEVALPAGVVVAQDDPSAAALGEPGGEIRDGKITLFPEPGRFYIARSEILPLVLLS